MVQPLQCQPPNWPCIVYIIYGYGAMAKIYNECWHTYTHVQSYKHTYTQTDHHRAATIKVAAGKTANVSKRVLKRNIQDVTLKTYTKIQTLTLLLKMDTSFIMNYSDSVIIPNDSPPSKAVCKTLIVKYN